MFYIQNSLQKYITYLPVEEAETVLRSYFVSKKDGEFCKICQQVFPPVVIRQVPSRKRKKEKMEIKWNKNVKC